MPSQRSRSDSCFSTSSKGSAKKTATKKRKGLHKMPEGRMSNKSTDPSKQVLIWDYSGDKKFKMPIGELYDKVGCENVKEEPIPRKGRVSFEGAIFDMPKLLRIQRIFGQWRTLYIVGAS